MDYLMVTKYENVFDRIGEIETYYPKGYIHNNINETNFEPSSNCLFINLKYKKAFKGTLIQIQKSDNEKIWFKAKLLSELIFDNNFINEKSGWWINNKYSNYTIKNDFIKEPEKINYFSNNKYFIPPVIDELINTSDFRKFEELTYYLLKLIGINEIIKIEPARAQGRSDGFFMIKNLAVIYDCKLSKKFIEDNAQPQNYLDQLQHGQISYSNKIYSFINHQKAVWFITKGSNRIIKSFNNIFVKEVTIESLINIYIERLEKNLNEIDLEHKLMNI